MAEYTIARYLKRFRQPQFMATCGWVKDGSDAMLFDLETAIRIATHFRHASEVENVVEYAAWKVN